MSRHPAMRSPRRFPSAMAVAALWTATAAQAAAAPAIGVQGAWSRPVAAGLHQGVAYLVITNRGPRPDTLLGASTPVADKAEPHESMMAGDMMRMRPVAPLPIPPGAAVAFRPGGLHLMLTGLRRPLKAGERYPLTLVFAHAGEVATQVTVGAGPPAP